MADISDMIFMNPAITEDDTAFAEKFFGANRTKYEEKRKKSVFSPVEDADFIKEMDMAIKAIVQHNINKRQQGGL